MLQHRIILIMLMAAALLDARAQQFSVKTFRQLNNDITAFVTPVYDLNEKACALVKVVCNHDFAFSTPLGIVKRQNKEGEVWLYLPAGTVKLTLKHPEWGVLRDYQLPAKLESRLTYELIVQQPLRMLPPSATSPVSTSPSPSSSGITPPMVITISRNMRLPLTILAQATLSTDSHHVMAGIRLAAMRSHGLYASFSTDFRPLPEMKDPNALETYETGDVCRRQRLVCAGFIHQIGKSIYLYEGAGWGKHLAAFKQMDGKWMKQADQSHEGWAAELGAGFTRHHLTASAGVQTITGHVWLITIGGGWKF